MNEIDLLRERQILRAKKILETHGIKLEVDGCGCCGSPTVRMEYNGEEIIGLDSGTMAHCRFDMFEKG